MCLLMKDIYNATMMIRVITCLVWPCKAIVDSNCNALVDNIL